jgi:purine nucleosidase/pyrimidine-specific ribonucleoside hydrolase
VDGIPVLIDCDPGQDDAIALLLALASPELELLGVTTVAGNQTLDKTTLNALKVLELAGRSDVPVAAGADRPLVAKLVTAGDAHGETGLDGPALPMPSSQPLEQHAVDFVAERVLASERPVTLVPLGPLTNVALFLAQRPEAAAKLDRIVLMGGAIAEGNMTPSAEFNIWVDPEAAARVFESGHDITMVGLDVTDRAVLTAEHADGLRSAGGVGTAVAEMLDFYGSFYREVYDHGGCPVHDAVAVAHVIRPGLVETVARHVAVELGSGLCRGRTVVDMRRRLAAPEPTARVAVDIDVGGFRELLLGRLRSLAGAAA